MSRLVRSGLDGANWLWIGWTLFTVARYGGAVLVDPSTTARIMGVSTDGVVHSAIGLSYGGLEGALLVAAELGIVAVALPASHSRDSRLRRPALLLLLAWSLLWLANAVWLQQLAGGRHAARSVAFGVLVALVGIRAAVRWGPTGAGAQPPTTTRSQRPPAGRMEA